MQHTGDILSKLEEAKTLLDKNPLEKKKCNLHFLMRSQFTYNMLMGIGESGYTLATLITDLAELEPAFLGMSWIGIEVGLPLALLFALAEAYSHNSESDHFNHSEHATSLHESENQESPPIPLSWKQEGCAILHYLSDVHKGAAFFLSIYKIAENKLAIPSFPYRLFSYTGIGLFSMLGNAQEYVNTRIAFKKENEREKEHAEKNKKCCV